MSRSASEERGSDRGHKRVVLTSRGDAVRRVSDDGHREDGHRRSGDSGDGQHHRDRRERSPREREDAPPRPSDRAGKGSPKGAGRGYGGGGGQGGGGRGRGARAPPPRPGFDDDARLRQLEDDPRYFDNAELGKAQRAVLGETNLNGRNTASFDPASTLVRPSMRVLYGKPYNESQKRFGSSLRPDDVVAVPFFFGDGYDYYGHVAEELDRLQQGKCDDLGEASRCQSIVKKICRYLSVDRESVVLTVSWMRGGSQQHALELTSGESGGSSNHNCTVFYTLGQTRELACWRSDAEDSIYFSQPDGQLLFISRDVAHRWKHGDCALRPGLKDAQGHISFALKGRCAAAVEETILATRKPPEKPGPCRDFKLGRCSYGDRCRFSHGDAGQEAKDNVPTFDPTSQLVRPSMRIITTPTSARYAQPVKHDDVIIVPDFFSEKDGWDIYYKLIEEMRACQARGDRKAEWLSWHEGAHLLSQNPEGSATYHKVLDKMCEYFSIAEGNRGTRFNWYRDGSDWKPFHHDSAAFNPMRAKNQNCTVGISFGTSRELAFRHAKTEELVYFPQTNGMLFYFGRDANIRWQHGINALPATEQDGKGRISIILWGWCGLGVEEDGSPPMLDDESRGKGKGKGKGGFSMHGQAGVCRDFQRGSCTRGERCSFAHTR